MGDITDEAELISQLIGDIYDAVLDRTLWPSVIEKTCHYVGGQSGALVALGPTRSEAQFHFEWGTDPEFVESYQRTYGLLNPLHVPTLMQAKVGSVLATTDIVPHDEILACRFYKEWLTPQGIVDAISATFEKSALSYSMLSIHRGKRDGMVDDATRRRMRLVAPHFQRAVGIGRIIDLHKFEAAALADSLDGLAAATILVDGSGRIVHANAAGDAMLARGAVLRAAGGKLTANDPQTDRTLHETFMNAETGAAAIGAGVPLRGLDGDRWVAHVLPLTASARRKTRLNYSAAAAVFVRKATLEPAHPFETIADVYKLTTAEMRVLMGVVQIGGVPEIVPVLGIAETTVKTHLRHVFEKTSTKRQADLVKLVAGYMSPLAG
jgi:DNA-binding CsgD family transcriptional regulator